VFVAGPRLRCPLRYRRPAGTKRVLSQDEENWLNLKPKFSAPVEPELKAPHGTAKPFVPESFAKREAEYAWLVATQNFELPSLAQEFKANGLDAFSLSSSPEGEDDDEMTSANLAEKHLGFVPYDPDPETVAALMRRIAWEKTVVYSSQAVRIYAASTEDGRRTLRCNDKRWTKDDVLAYAQRMRDILGERDIADVENARDRAAHYRALVWSLMSPAEQASWRYRDPAARAYLDCSDDNVARESWDIPHREVIVGDDFVDPTTLADGGPQELGLHTLDEDGAVAYEPTEFDLWPLSA
jgi:hypothetical protein